MKLSPGTAIRIWLILLLSTVAFGAVYNLRLIGPFYTPTPVDSPDQPLRFVIVSPQADHPFWQSIFQAASKTGDQLRVTIEYIGPRRAALDEQVRLLDMVTAAQVDGIITEGVPDEQVAAAIAKAVDRGIPVITVGTDLPGGRRLAYVGSDSYLAGRQAGQELIRRTKGKAVVGIIRGDLSPESEDARLQGFREALVGHAGIRVVATESSGLNRTVALQKTWQILREHPEVTVLYGTTALDLVGIARGVNVPEWRGQVLVMGWDVSVETEDYVARGLINLSVEQDPQAMGSRAVEALEAYLRRDIRPSKRLLTPFTLRTGGEMP